MYTDPWASYDHWKTTPPQEMPSEPEDPPEDRWPEDEYPHEYETGESRERGALR